jgi:hypothetical protein
VCCYHSLQSQVCIVVRRIGMFLIRIFVELRVVAGKSRTRSGSPQAVLCHSLENGMVRAWHGRGMASVNQTRPRCVNQMGKTQSKPLGARHGRGTAWARHAMCESASNIPPVCLFGMKRDSLYIYLRCVRCSARPHRHESSPYLAQYY